MVSKGDFLNKVLDYLWWLHTRWYFWVFFIFDIAIRLPFGNLKGTPVIIYFMHMIDAWLIVVIILSVIIGIKNLIKKKIKKK